MGGFLIFYHGYTVSLLALGKNPATLCDGKSTLMTTRNAFDKV